MLTLFWIVLGALIGVAAAQRKGFSTIGGIIGGMLLGPLALLMFGVSGGSGQRRKCPHCAEWVQAAARVCKHCRGSLPPMKRAA